jgi:pyruvate formate lyase activating enzyme
MNIAGLTKCSFADYPGNLSAVVYTPGCNMDCYYCHNQRLLGGPVERHDVNDVLSLLARRKGMLDAVVVSGGEATLQAGLADFLAACRQMGYATKLDTNGTHPEVIDHLLARDLLDYVAMDIKAPLHRYEQIVRTAIDRQAVQASIDLLLAGHVDCEFRTTFAPPLTSEDVVLMAMKIRGAPRYALQQYRPLDGAAPRAYDDLAVRQAAELARPFVGEVIVRGLRERSSAPRDVAQAVAAAG